MKQVLKGVIFIMLSAGMLIAAGFFLRPLNVDNSTARVKAFHTLPKDSVDVLTFGASSGLRGINTLMLAEQYGINAFNYCGNWQKFNTANMFFHEAITFQDPKLVIFELKNVGRVLRNKDMNGEIYYTREARWTGTKVSYLRQCFGKDFERYVSYFLPVYSFHENWSEPGIFSRKEYPLQKVLDNRGYAPIEKVTPITPGSNEEQKPLKGYSRTLLDDIVKTCGERGIEVLFLTVPCEADFVYSDAVKEYAAENGCAFIDGYELFDELGLDPLTDYMDPDHVNSAGAAKVTAYLGEYIREHYDLPDIRNI